MKKLVALLVLGFFGLGTNAIAQNNLPKDVADFPYWIEMMQDQNANYYTTVAAFEA